MLLQLTRKQMTELLYALKGESSQHPIAIFQKALGENSAQNEKLSQLISKMKRKNRSEFGLSTNEIVSLANLCELTSLKSTSIQNWIKRDVKELIGAPELGKKYSIEQTAILLIVKDLKGVFDFEKIRNLLIVVFNTLSDRSDDLISPIAFYEIYANILETIDHMPSIKFESLEQLIIEKIEIYAQHFSNLSTQQWKPIRNVLVIMILAVLASHIQSRAHDFFRSHFALD